MSCFWITPEGVVVIMDVAGLKYIRKHTCCKCHGWLGKHKSTCKCEPILHDHHFAIPTQIDRGPLVAKQFEVVEDRYDADSFP